ncbi:MAG TPA: ComF family protein [Caulobacteraceae bacterium]|nr:ComF family protein [Caulobacteraceae bacterium]
MGPQAMLGRLRPMAREAARAAVDLVLPPRPLDGAPGRAAPVLADGLTSQAWANIRFIDPPVCDACGVPFEYDLGGASLCPACAALRPAFDRARAACLYDEASRDLILQLKHADRTELARLFAAWITRAAADLIADADAVTPVPLHRWRLLKRRFNQAAEIARPLARQARVAYFADALMRRRDTGSQAGRSGSGRRRNVAAAFEVPERWKGRVEGARIILIDDVLTTGATAEACARALKRAGAAAVDVAVIARVSTRRLG